jgi:hypothetical protein
MRTGRNDGGTRFANNEFANITFQPNDAKRTYDFVFLLARDASKEQDAYFSGTEIVFIQTNYTYTLFAFFILSL